MSKRFLAISPTARRSRGDRSLTGAALMLAVEPPLYRMQSRDLRRQTLGIDEPAAGIVGLHVQMDREVAGASRPGAAGEA